MSGRPVPGAAGARLSELFTRHAATVLGLCRMLLRNREEAEDAVQQTFLAAYRSLLNGVEPRHPAAWLATIARNECWGRIQQRRREPLPGSEPKGTLPDPVAAAAARADLAELWRAIGDLPSQQREALLLREFSGLSYAELAEAMAVSEPAVESLLFRARRGLRVRLRPAHGAASVAPLTAIREALARAIDGMPDPVAAGVLAKVASAPLAAKLVAGTAAIVVAGGAVAELGRGPRPRIAEEAAAAAVPSPAVRGGVRATVAERRELATPRRLQRAAAARSAASVRGRAVPDTNPARDEGPVPTSTPAATPTRAPRTDDVPEPVAPTIPTLPVDVPEPLPVATPAEEPAEAPVEDDDGESLRSIPSGEDEDDDDHSGSSSGPGSGEDEDDGEGESSGSSGSGDSGEGSSDDESAADSSGPGGGEQSCSGSGSSSGSGSGSDDPSDSSGPGGGDLEDGDAEADD